MCECTMMGVSRVDREGGVAIINIGLGRKTCIPEERELNVPSN